jgi:hypothetical protein
MLLGRNGSTVASANMKKIKRHQQFSDFEERCRDRGAKPNIAPSTDVSGSHLNIMANNSVITPKEIIHPTMCNAAPCGQRYLPLAESRAKQQRDQQQEPERQDSNGDEIGAHELPDSTLFRASTSHTVFSASLRWTITPMAASSNRSKQFEPRHGRSVYRYAATRKRNAEQHP